MGHLFRALASLRLTVILLALSMLLVFVGTIAQTRLGVWQVVDSYFRSPVAWVDPSIFTGAEGAAALRVPMPGGLLLGSALFANLVAAHGVRFRVTRRKVGILVIHAGLVVLLAGEFVTGALSREGLMRIDEGAAASHLEDVRRAELVVLDPTDPAMDRLVRIPTSLIRRASVTGQPIRDPRLPFDIRVDQWLPSAALWRVPESGFTSPATAGVGLDAFAREAPGARGVDGGDTDLPGAYVTLTCDGQTLGTWLLWAGLDEPQGVTFGGTTYSIALRFVRTHLPFSIHLTDFRHDTFTGTTIPRNFSSDVRIVDPERGVDRPVRVWMNNPLRYRGLAFYQASYKPDGSGTVLQVVRNPGWLLPYIACVIVSAGLLWHFTASLTRFLKRARPSTPPSVTSSRNPGPSGELSTGEPRARPLRWFAIVGLAIGLLLAIAPLLRGEGDRALAAFGRLPVSSGGRVKPMDTAARNLLMLASGRGQVATPQGAIPAIQFLVDLIALEPGATRDLPLVRVDDPGVLSLLGRGPDRGGRLALSAIEPHWPEVARQADQASRLNARERDAFQHAVLQLHSRVNTVLAHQQMRDPLVVPPLTEGESWRSFHEAFLDDAGGLDAARLASGGAEAPESLPPGFEPHPAVAYFTAMMSAYSAGDQAGFERAVQAYDELLARDLPGERGRARLEALFSRASLFAGAMWAYLLGVLALLASFLLRALNDRWALRGSAACRSGAAGLVWGGVIVHTVAILARMWLQDRPPVTNLYSSAIFVGWAGALLGMVVERAWPVGLSALGAASLALCTLVVAHNLGNDGDTMQMMQAVLDSNFWLATHVVTITLGYSAAFLAGAMAALWALAAAWTRVRVSPWSAAASASPPDRLRTLSKAIYGVVCFALLLSFVGTVLGGIWADQSWGRFWGWDPKENGAALIVLHMSLILHARWGGLIRERGLAMLALGGSVVTAWSWFGTNMLGTGLHSYGFTDSASTWLAIFVGVHIALIALAGWAGRGHSRAIMRLAAGDRPLR